MWNLWPNEMTKIWSFIFIPTWGLFPVVSIHILLFNNSRTIWYLVTVNLMMENTWLTVSCDAFFWQFWQKNYCYNEHSFYFYDFYLKNSIKENFNELPKKTITFWLFILKSNLFFLCKSQSDLPNKCITWKCEPRVFHSQIDCAVTTIWVFKYYSEITNGQNNEYE